MNYILNWNNIQGVQTMKKFTKFDKEFAKNIDKQFKWIARDQNGDLYIFNVKPRKMPYKEWDITDFTEGCAILVWIEGALTIKPFEPIRWKDKEPTLISDIYMTGNKEEDE